jgi:hypothetical protein
MKKRYIYILLFGIPGLFVAGVISIILFGVVVGVLWLYIFGDNSWPSWSEAIISTLFVTAFLLLWASFLILGYFVGRRLEKDPALNRRHVAISVGLTVMFLLFILLQQWSVGNLGPKADSMLCSDFCTQHGYSASGIPSQISGNRTCSCYDTSGNEAIRIPLDHLQPGGPK